MGKNYKFHGDPNRFPVVAEFIRNHYGNKIKYIADVAGGQGMLTKILRKKYNYEAEVVDPRGWRMKGVPGREENFTPKMASYYDLVVGLHPDEATNPVAKSALKTNTLLIPCCNFWDQSKTLGTIKLVEAIEKFYKENNVKFERIELDIKRPKNIALITKFNNQ